MERFWAKVDRGQCDACWLWQASKRDGYGLFMHEGKSLGAHRVAWELANGRPVAAGKVIMHSCDNRACCNPAHLREGTQSENLRDMVSKGRNPNRAGSRHHLTDLTDDDVRTIRGLRAGKVRLSTIAADYRISIGAVHDIVLRKTWGHVL